MKYSFSGHESFMCKSLWLKKGYDFVNQGRGFNDNDAVVRLGVGKNMVSSIKFWMKAFALVDESGLTDIARYLFDGQSGKDQYAEDINTLWILHYLLVSRGISSIYKLLFIDFQREKRIFDKEQLLLFIKRKCNAPEQKNVYNENTVKKDIRVLLQNYLAPENPKSYEEYTALLITLGLIQRNGTNYSYNETPIDAISPIVIFYALNDIREGDLTISSEKLRDLSLIFCMQISEFLKILRNLSLEFPDILSYTDNSGVRNIQFLQNLTFTDILDKYYNNHELLYSFN